jgi:hypothetical protein
MSRNRAKVHLPRCRHTGKRSYPSRKAADVVLSRIWRRCKPGRRMENRAYHCNQCSGWHLTSMPLAKGA